MNEPQIRPLTADDEHWFRDLWRKCEPELGELWVTGGPTFHRWLAEPENVRLRIDGVTGLAFVHYLVRKDGGRTIYNIAVDPAARGAGLGRALVEHVSRGASVRLSTNADNAGSNRFYRALGFRLVERKMSEGGVLLNGWERPAVRT